MFKTTSYTFFTIGLFIAVTTRSTKAQEPRPADKWFSHLEERPDRLDLLSKSITTADIEKMIDDQNIQSPEALLEALYETSPDLFQNPTLVFSSLAIQEASYENPRVILLSKNGKLAITYNGARTQLGFHDVEIQEYDEDAGKFKLTEKDFSPHNNPSLPPMTCATCHAFPYKDERMMRPLIEPYPTWSRMYGGSLSLSKENREVKEYEAFKKMAVTHPRYKFLKLEPVLDDGESDDDQNNPGPGSTGIPNNADRLRDAMTIWNVDRIVKLLSQDPRYSQIRPQLLNILKDEKAHPAAEQYYDDEEYVFDKNSKRRDRVFNEQAAYFGNSEHRLTDKDRKANPQIEFHYERPQKLITFLKDSLGFDLWAQEMAVDKNDVNFASPTVYFLDTFATAVEHMQPSTSLAALNVNAFEEDRSVDRHLQMNCVNCHRQDNSINAPYIPFADDEKLKAMMTPDFARRMSKVLRSKDPSTRMPLGFAPLSDDQIDQMELKFNLMIQKQNCDDPSGARKDLKLLDIVIKKAQGK